MHIADGHWRCDMCGGRLDDVPLNKVPVGERLLLSNNVMRRVLRVDGQIVHRCETKIDTRDRA